MKTWLWIIKICLPLKHHFSTSSSWRLSLSKVLKSSSSKQAGHKLGPLDADEPSARSQLLNELLKASPISLFCCFSCITFRVESRAWVRKCERRLLIGHYTLLPRKSDKLKPKEPTYGWTQSFFMKGFSISQLKNDHQSGWKQQGKPPPCQNLLSRIVSIPPKKEPFTIIRWCSCHLKLMTAFFFFQCLPRSRWFVWQTVASLLKDIWDLIRLAPDSRSFARSMEVRRPPFYCLAC